MPIAYMKLPIGITYPEPSTEVPCEGATVGEAIADVLVKEPRLEPRIYKDGQVWVGIFLNGRNVRSLQGMDTPISEGDKLMLVPPIPGG